jgi:DHA1 family multidrug resistance protein-like MFS transporter
MEALVNEPDSTSNSIGRSMFFLVWAITTGSLAFAFLEFGLPIYGRSIGASALEIGGLYTTQAVIVVIMRPIVGWGLDRIGRKPFLVGALVCYTAAMALFARANGLVDLYIAQFVMGFASAMLAITAFTIGADLAPSDSRAHVMGRVLEASARGAVIGAVGGFSVMSVLNSLDTWHVVFTGYAIAALVALGVVWRKVPETRAETPSAAVRQPLSRHLARLVVIVLITSTSYGMVRPIYLIFLQDRFTTDIITLALAYFPAGVAASFLPSRLGRLSDRLGRAPLMATGMLISAGLSVCLPLVPGLIWLIVLFTLEQIGGSMAGPAEAAMVADLAGSDVRGMGYGIYTAATWVGSAVGPLIGGLLYDHISEGMPFFLNAGMLVLGATLVLVLLREKVLASAPASEM